MAAILLLGSLGGAGSARGQSPGSAPAAESPVRFGYSRRIFDSVNENDGRAALKLHAAAIGQAEGIAMYVDQQVFDGAADINRALAAGTVDLLAVPTDLFFELTPTLVTGPLIVAIVDGRADDEYLIVVNRKSGIENLARLKGRRLGILQNVRAPFSRVWLEVLARRDQLGPANQFFGEITPAGKASRVVLPVFFGQVDAGVVTRQNLKVMGELNPQISTQLHVLANSAPIVSSLMCFRAGVSPATIDRVAASACKMHSTVSGRQVMTIFKSDRLATLPVTGLDSARALLDEHARLQTVSPGRAAVPVVVQNPSARP